MCAAFDAARLAVPWAIALQPTELGYEPLTKAEPCATAIGWECAPTPPPLVRWREQRDPEVWSPVSLRIWEDGKVVETGVARARQVVSAYLGRPWFTTFPPSYSQPELNHAVAFGRRIESLGLARMVLLDLVDGEVRERNP